MNLNVYNISHSFHKSKIKSILFWILKIKITCYSIVFQNSFSLILPQICINKNTWIPSCLMLKKV